MKKITIETIIKSRDLPQDYIFMFGDSYEAIIIKQILSWSRYNQKNNKNLKDGHYWVYYSASAIAEKEFDNTIGSRAVSKKLMKLVNMGLLVRDNFNKFRYDRTFWYRVDEEKLEQFFSAYYDKYSKSSSPKEIEIVKIEPIIEVMSECENVEDITAVEPEQLYSATTSESYEVFEQSTCDEEKAVKTTIQGLKSILYKAGKYNTTKETVDYAVGGLYSGELSSKFLKFYENYCLNIRTETINNPSIHMAVSFLNHLKSPERPVYSSVNLNMTRSAASHAFISAKASYDIEEIENFITYGTLERPAQYSKGV